MSELLANYLSGLWSPGQGPGTALRDPVLGDELARVDATGLNLRAGFAHARDHAGPALRGMSYRERGELLSAVVRVLQANRDGYFAIACANSGTVKNDSAIDIDGAIYTLSTYAKLAATLGDRLFLLDGEAEKLVKDGSFQTQHLLVPTRGVALFINAFNFPAWGLWEKAGPAILSGVPVIVKPATATAWLAHQMVKDVIAAGVLPPGALSIVCGNGAGLMDALEAFDVVSFTGSAEAAAAIRSHPAVTQRSVRANIEADSINAAVMLPGEIQGSAAFDAMVKEVVREMTVKSGQKCTAIRRVFVPAEQFASTADAISSRLAKTTVGNPRNETVRMGSLVSRGQLSAVREGLAALRQDTRTLHDGAKHALIDADANTSCCIGPTLLGVDDADTAARVHETEVFGPVATLIPYRNADDAWQLVRRGQGSLVVSLYGSDEAALASAAMELAAFHGRVHAVSPEVVGTHTGHGNVMPQSLHGGPGRAGGGEELGGLRALHFYHRRLAVQAGGGVLTKL